MEAYLLVTEAEATAYQAMKTELAFGEGESFDKHLLSYIKVKAINRFNPNNTKIGMQ